MSGVAEVEARPGRSHTRQAVVRYLVGARRPVGVAELSSHLGLNHNGVRRHLARLVDAGLVDEMQAAPAGRGRPRRTYTVRPTPYERLSLLLIAALRSGEPPAEAGRRSMHGPGGELALEDVIEAIGRQGFDPAIEHRDGDRVEIALRTCPFEAAALADPEVVCGIHRGIVDGITEQTNGAVDVEDLTAVDPTTGPCRLRLRVHQLEERHV